MGECISCTASRDGNLGMYKPRTIFDGFLTVGYRLHLHLTLPQRQVSLLRRRQVQVGTAHLHQPLSELQVRIDLVVCIQPRHLPCLAWTRTIHVGVLQVNDA